jgi:hypothetical protein
MVCDLNRGCKEIYRCGDPDKRSRLPQHVSETTRDQPRPEAATGSVQPLDDRVDVQADEGKCGAEQATNGEERKTTHRIVGQVRKPARTDESANAKTRDEDRNRNEHVDILVVVPDGIRGRWEESEALPGDTSSHRDRTFELVRPREAYRV